jgi:hypothetical protein
MEELSRQAFPDPKWADMFRKVFENATMRYRAGEREADHLVHPKEADFLVSIGSAPHELYDYVEDWCEVGEPPFETVLGIAAVRYEYFVAVQRRTRSLQVLSADSFPSGAARLGGFPWLPRIIAKARAKLRGELPRELMYGCGADRPFLQSVGLTLTVFLQTVWEAGDDDREVLARVEESARLV